MTVYNPETSLSFENASLKYELKEALKDLISFIHYAESHGYPKDMQRKKSAIKRLNLLEETTACQIPPSVEPPKEGE